jgi:lipoprotein-releasing system ATP-binding protein
MNEVANPVLACQHVVKRYRQGEEDVLVLEGVELQIKPGERVAIVGASGSGKSTLLNVLGGLDEPQAGVVTVAGRDWRSMAETERAAWRNRQIGFVYQFHHLLAEFSALENVSMPLLIAGQTLAEATAASRAMLVAVGLEHRLTHKPSRLSGGERQRVAIARALVNRPACVLMDEPTGNLDAETAQQVQNLLNGLNRQFGMAFVLVTHDRQLAAQQDRCLQLAQGRLTDLSLAGAE